MPKRSAVPPLVPLLAPLALSACELPFASDTLCTGDVVPAVRVAVRDSATNAPAGTQALVVARDGAYADTARGSAATPDLFTFGLAAERPGSYDVTVEQPGYRTWRRDGVRVTRGQCHVNRVDLTALLQRAP